MGCSSPSSREEIEGGVELQLSRNGWGSPIHEPRKLGDRPNMTFESDIERIVREWLDQQEIMRSTCIRSTLTPIARK